MNLEAHWHDSIRERHATPSIQGIYGRRVNAPVREDLS
jgi:hypothetical protein